MSAIGCVLADELEELAIGTAVALLGRCGGVPSRVADERAQLLQVGTGVLAREARRCLVVGDQLGAPTLGPVQRERVARMAEPALVDGGARLLDVARAHELADQLHLPATRFVAAGAARAAQCIEQRLVEAERRELLVAEPEQRLAERLQLVRCDLAPRLARPLGRSRAGGVAAVEGRVVGRGTFVHRARRKRRAREDATGSSLS